MSYGFDLVRRVTILTRPTIHSTQTSKWLAADLAQDLTLRPPVPWKLKISELSVGTETQLFQRRSLFGATALPDLTLSGSTKKKLRPNCHSSVAPHKTQRCLTANSLLVWERKICQFSRQDLHYNCRLQSAEIDGGYSNKPWTQSSTLLHALGYLAS